MFIISRQTYVRFLTAVFALASFLTFSIIAPDNASANSKYAAFVYDANKGKVLFARHADSTRFPASLTKMMTLYMVFDAIDAGKISLSTRMKVSAKAAKAPPSKLYLKPGSTIRVKDAILALVTKSANDVAVVIAEHLGGSESNFAKQMTRKARSIGMTRTTFRNASGLPNSKQRTTARDMARLGLSLRRNHPRSFKYFDTRFFKYGKQTYRNHNRLLGRVRGVNGIKTGYIRASGFNLVTNVEDNGRHIVAVVMGGRTGRSRDAHMADLIKRHFKKASRKKSNSDPLLVAALKNPPVPRPNPLAELLVAKQETPSIEAPTPRPASKQPAVVTANVVAPENENEQGSREDITEIIKPKVVRVSKIVVEENGSSKIVKANPAPAPAATKVAKPKTTTPKVVAAKAPEQPEKSKKPTGWKIQISATPSLNGAKKLLAEASQKGAPVLKKAIPYTEPVKSGSSTLYRVRFAGFDNKKSARQVCAFMKKKRYRCIAIN